MEIKRTESEEFVNRINGKEPVAWEELYARYYKALCAYSASLTGDAAFAEDLVQELLLRMWQSERTFSVLPELAAYLYRSVYHNRWLTGVTAATASHCYGTCTNSRCATKFPPPPLRSRSRYRAACRNGRGGVIRRLYSDIHALPSEQSRIIRLSIAGFKGAEIARRLGISINTVKTQKYRGYRSLRLKLSKFFFLFGSLLALLTGLK